MTDTSDKPPVLSRETLVPIGVAVACLLPIAGGAIWIRESMKDNQNAIESLAKDMNARFNALESKTGNGWNVADMELWVLRFQRDNPAIKVPDVRK